MYSDAFWIMLACIKNTDIKDGSITLNGADISRASALSLQTVVLWKYFSKMWVLGRLEGKHLPIHSKCWHVHKQAPLDECWPGLKDIK